ncbi:hypothetical protein, partial [Parvimonas micra]|uniref:hypothetical protein n=2 Tax=Parvimonas TaxID=543311 RepID=UPI002B49C05C
MMKTMAAEGAAVAGLCQYKQRIPGSKRSYICSERAAYDFGSGGYGACIHHAKEMGWKYLLDQGLVMR